MSQPRLTILVSVDGVQTATQSLETLLQKAMALGNITNKSQMQLNSVRSTVSQNAEGKLKEETTFGFGMQQSGKGIREYADSLAQLGGIMHQVSSMYTSWNVWMIRQIQYQNQLVDALYREQRLRRQVITVDKEFGTILLQNVKLYEQLYTAQTKSIFGFDKIRKAALDTKIAMGMYGATSETAKNAQASLNQELISWGQEQVSRAAPEDRSAMLDKVNSIIDKIADMLATGQSINWQTIGEQVGWSGKFAKEYGSLGGYGLSVQEIATQLMDPIKNSIKMTIPIQTEIAKNAADYNTQMDAAILDIEVSRKKLKAATDEMNLIMPLMAFQALGVAGQGFGWLKDLMKSNKDNSLVNAVKKGLGMPVPVGTLEGDLSKITGKIATNISVGGDIPTGIISKETSEAVNFVKNAAARQPGLLATGAGTGAQIAAKSIPAATSAGLLSSGSGAGLSSTIGSLLPIAIPIAITALIGYGLYNNDQVNKQRVSTSTSSGMQAIMYDQDIQKFMDSFGKTDQGMRELGSTFIDLYNTARDKTNPELAQMFMTLGTGIGKVISRSEADEMVGRFRQFVVDLKKEALGQMILPTGGYSVSGVMSGQGSSADTMAYFQTKTQEKYTVENGVVVNNPMYRGGAGTPNEDESLIEANILGGKIPPKYAKAGYSEAEIKQQESEGLISWISMQAVRLMGSTRTLNKEEQGAQIQFLLSKGVKLEDMYDDQTKSGELLTYEYIQMKETIRDLGLAIDETTNKLRLQTHEEKEANAARMITEHKTKEEEAKREAEAVEKVKELTPEEKKKLEPMNALIEEYVSVTGNEKMPTISSPEDFQKYITGQLGEGDVNSEILEDLLDGTGLYTAPPPIIKPLWGETDAWLGGVATEGVVKNRGIVEPSYENWFSQYGMITNSQSEKGRAWMDSGYSTNIGSINIIVNGSNLSGRQTAQQIANALKDRLSNEGVRSTNR